MKLIFLCVLLIVLFIAYKIFSRKTEEKKEEHMTDRQEHVNQKEYLKYMHLAHPTKCFSCEKQFDYPHKYLGHATKCFSCEKQIAQQYGPEYAFYAQPNKCFSCEKQMNF